VSPPRTRDKTFNIAILGTWFISRDRAVDRGKEPARILHALRRRENDLPTSFREFNLDVSLLSSSQLGARRLKDFNARHSRRCYVNLFMWPFDSAATDCNRGDLIDRMRPSLFMMASDDPHTRC